MSVYREPRDPAAIRAVRFADLTAATRARLAASCQLRAASVPILRAPLPLLGQPGLYLAAALAPGAAAAGVAVARLGELGRGAALPLTTLDVSSLLTAALALAALAWRSRRLRQGLPFPAGDYLFARELVVARRGHLALIPTEALTLSPRPGGRVEARGPGDYRCPFDSPGVGRADVADELRASREALDRAEQQGDRATCLVLDPFADERATWSTGPAPATLRRSWLDASGVRALAAVALLAVWALVDRALGAEAERQALGAVALAEARGDEAALERLIEPSLPEALSPLRVSVEADAALLRLATRAADARPLRRYLEKHGYHAREAAEELHRRSRLDPTGDLTEHLARFGHGPRRAEADAWLLERAVTSQNELLLRRYVSLGGIRQDEVQQRILPRLLLDRAVRERDLPAMRHLEALGDRDAPVTTHRRGPGEEARPGAELRQEIRQAIDVLIGQERGHLRERTGLRTGLAQLVDRAMGEGVDVVPAPGLDPEAFGAIRLALSAVLHTYVPRSLLPLTSRDGRPMRAIVVRLEPPGGCPAPSCRRRLGLTFQEAVDPGSADPAIGPQDVLFSAPGDGGEGRPLQMAAQEALTRALLGDDRPPRR